MFCVFLCFILCYCFYLLFQIMDICFICLKKETNLINVNQRNGESENQIIHRFKNLVPDLVSPI